MTNPAINSEAESPSATSTPRHLDCPRCTFQLSIADNGSVQLDHCQRCHGTFFESGELAATFGEKARVADWASSDLVQERGPSALSCPLGHGALTAMTLAMDDADSAPVEVDLCSTCGGIWLDENEAAPVVAIIERAHQKVEAGQQSPPGGAGRYLIQLLTGIPIEVYNPVKRRPVAMRILFGLLVLFYFLQVWQSGLTLGVALVPSKIATQPWGLVTYMFAHLSVVHLAGNLYFYWIFGDNLEDVLGHWAFLALFFLTGLAGAVLQLFVQWGSDVPVIGASGAILGLMGAYLVLFPRAKVWVVWFFVRFKLSIRWYLGIYVGFNVVMALLSFGDGEGGTAWWVHIGGFLAGVALALGMRHRVQKRLGLS